MNIHISIDASTADEARHELRKLIGLGEARDIMAAMRATRAETETDDEPVWKHDEVGDGEKTAALVVDKKASLGETQANTNTAPTRKRGEPSPGHKRRTKAEIAEDERAEEAEMKAKMDPATQQLLAETQKGLAAISTGGARVAPDDDKETEQQDVADEADETAKAGAELSHENLRDALGQYVQKYGMDAAQLDGPKLFGLVFKDPAITKISAVPGDQKSLKAALDGINEMLAKNPFDRKVQVAA